MVCKVQLYEKPVLNDPVLIEGLPGIGFVANITALHLIKEYGAKLFAEIQSSAFQDLAITTENGGTYFPTNQFYYAKGQNGQRDLIILYGNTQALTTVGQYELCGKILDISQELGCKHVLTIGGLKKEEKIEKEMDNRKGWAQSYGNQALILKTLGKLPEAMDLHKKEEKIKEE